MDSCRTATALTATSKRFQNCCRRPATKRPWSVNGTSAATRNGYDYWNILMGQGPYYNPPMITTEWSTGHEAHTGYTTDIITDMTLDCLKEKRDPNKPFMLMYQHKAPHRNWQPGPKHLNMYDDVTIPEPETLFDDYAGSGTIGQYANDDSRRTCQRYDLKLKGHGTT